MVSRYFAALNMRVLRVLHMLFGHPTNAYRNVPSLVLDDGVYHYVQCSCGYLRLVTDD